VIVYRVPGAASRRGEAAERYFDVSGFVPLSPFVGKKRKEKNVS